jgi:hypothetical protein
MPQVKPYGINAPPELIERLSTSATTWLNSGSSFHSEAYTNLKAVWQEIRTHTAAELETEGRHDLAKIVVRAPKRTEMLQLKFSALTTAAYQYTDNPDEQTAEVINREWGMLMNRLRHEAERNLHQDTARDYPRS